MNKTQYLQDLRKELKSPAAAYIEFLQQNPKSSHYVFAFFEGQDDLSFYTNFLERFVTDVKKDVCGGKHGVYETHRKIMQHGTPKNIVLFFVDRDFSDLIGEQYPEESNIYVTDHYSVETYLVSSAMLRRVWDEIFHFPQGIDIDFEGIQDKFQDALQHFYQAIIPIIAWIIFHKRNGQHVTSDDIKPGDFCKIDDDDLTLQSVYEADVAGAVQRLDTVCVVTTPAEALSAINTVMDELTALPALPPKRYVRGKFELWFFVQFLKRLIDLLNARTIDGGERLKVTASPQPGYDNAMALLAPRLRIPPSLDAFLRRNLGRVALSTSR